MRFFWAIIGILLISFVSSQEQSSALHIDSVRLLVGGKPLEEYNGLDTKTVEIELSVSGSGFLEGTADVGSFNPSISGFDQKSFQAHFLKENCRVETEGLVCLGLPLVPLHTDKQVLDIPVLLSGTEGSFRFVYHLKLPWKDAVNKVVSSKERNLSASNFRILYKDQPVQFVSSLHPRLVDVWFDVSGPVKSASVTAPRLIPYTTTLDAVCLTGSNGMSCVLKDRLVMVKEASGSVMVNMTSVEGVVSGTELLYSVILDDTSPELVGIMTPVCVNGVCYLKPGVPTNVTVVLQDLVGTLDQRLVAFQIGGGVAQLVDNCSGFTCVGVFKGSCSGKVQANIAFFKGVPSEDDAGNLVVGKPFPVVCDGSAPVVKSLVLNASEGRDFVLLNDVVTITATVADDTPVVLSVDLSLGGVLSSSLNHTVQAPCVANGSGRQLCRLSFTNANPGPLHVSLPLTFTDSVGNSVVKPVGMEILKTEEQQAPDNFDIDSVKFSPNRVNVQTLQLFNKKVLTNVLLKHRNSAVKVLSVESKSCVLPVGIGAGFALPVETLSSGNDGMSLVSQVSLLPSLPWVLGSLEVQCTLAITSRDDRMLYLMPELENYSFSPSFYNGVTMDFNVQQEIDRVTNGSLDDLRKVLKNLERVNKLAQMGCGLKNLLMQANSVCAGIDAALGGFPPSQPAGEAANDCSKGLAKDLNKVEKSQLGQLCSFLQCNSEVNQVILRHLDALPGMDRLSMFASTLGGVSPPPLPVRSAPKASGKAVQVTGFATRQVPHWSVGGPGVPYGVDEGSLGIKNNNGFQYSTRPDLQGNYYYMYKGNTVYAPVPPSDREGLDLVFADIQRSAPAFAEQLYEAKQAAGASLKQYWPAEQAPTPPPAATESLPATHAPELTPTPIAVSEPVPLAPAHPPPIEVQFPVKESKPNPIIEEGPTQATLLPTGPVVGTPRRIDPIVADKVLKPIIGAGATEELLLADKQVQTAKGEPKTGSSRALPETEVSQTIVTTNPDYITTSDGQVLHRDEDGNYFDTKNNPVDLINEGGQICATSRGVPSSGESCSEVSLTTGVDAKTGSSEVGQTYAPDASPQPKVSSAEQPAPVVKPEAKPAGDDSAVTPQSTITPAANPNTPAQTASGTVATQQNAPNVQPPKPKKLPLWLAYYRPENSLIVSAMSMCLPGITYNLEKMATIDCEYIRCLKLDVPAGLPPQECQRDHSYQHCKFVTGEVFNAIPYTAVYQGVMQEVRKVVTNPYSLATLVISMLPCDSLHTPLSGVCRLPKAMDYLNKMMKVLGNIRSVASQFAHLKDSFQSGDTFCDQVLKLEVPDYLRVPLDIRNPGAFFYLPNVGLLENKDGGVRLATVPVGGGKSQSYLERGVSLLPLEKARAGRATTMRVTVDPANIKLEPSTGACNQSPRSSVCIQDKMDMLEGIKQQRIQELISKDKRFEGVDWSRLDQGDVGYAMQLEREGLLTPAMMNEGMQGLRMRGDLQREYNEALAKETGGAAPDRVIRLEEADAVAHQAAIEAADRETEARNKEAAAAKIEQDVRKAEEAAKEVRPAISGAAGVSDAQEKAASLRVEAEKARADAKEAQRKAAAAKDSADEAAAKSDRVRQAAKAQGENLVKEPKISLAKLHAFMFFAKFRSAMALARNSYYASSLLMPNFEWFGYTKYVDRFFNNAVFNLQGYAQSKICMDRDGTFKRGSMGSQAVLVRDPDLNVVIPGAHVEGDGNEEARLDSSGLVIYDYIVTAGVKIFKGSGLQFDVAAFSGGTEKVVLPMYTMNASPSTYTAVGASALKFNSTQVFDKVCIRFKSSNLKDFFEEVRVDNQNRLCNLVTIQGVEGGH